MAGLSLDGRAAIVTGGSSGIGFASAKALAANGAAVTIAGRSLEKAESAAEQLISEGHRAIPFAVDMGGDESGIQDLVEATVEEFGGLDILHNNAAALTLDVIVRDTTVLDIDADIFSHVLRVNVIGYALAAKFAIPHMIRKGRGVIINTASVGGQASEVLRPMYERPRQQSSALLETSRPITARTASGASPSRRPSS